MNEQAAPGGIDVRVLLLQRRGCHLCQEAAPDVARVAAAVGVRWAAVDVDDNPVLREAFGDAVPVVLVDGREIARYRVVPQRLREALEG
ncbi:glutaredoxin family protein [Serinibacter salmoneus]|uniref:Glutaredoxin-like protein DUF836 n=1 Tax=Serinibacter salmoneus TaxID=556530 RepID=A0A2A9D1L3_9MICO|nr:glutaredoxin family protein [Serinibacter salmoneus]PFG20577.1 glutaredoxin-like protein DUF836 [Serinibacter salmoneus]